MGGGCGPLQSGSSPSIFLEGAEELVAMETGKRQRDAGRYWGQAEIHTLDPLSHIHTPHRYIPASMESDVKFPPKNRVTQAPLQTHRCMLNSFTQAHSDV